MIELDLSKHSFGALAPWLPSGLWVTIACCVVLGIVAWACAWRGVRRSEKASDLEIFIAFPFTHLFFMPFFIWRDWKSARPSVTVYMSIIVVWWFGGFFTQHIEQTKLDQLIAEMEANGEFLQYPKKQVTFDESDQDNIWSHPFLFPMVQINERSERGEILRSQSPYDALTPPFSFSFQPPFRAAARNEIGGVLLDLYEMAATIINEQTTSFSSSMLPTDWPEMGHTVMGYYQPFESQFSLQEEALNRPRDIFPFPEQDGLQIYVNHLSGFKQLSRASKLRSSALIAMGESEKSHREMLTGLRFADSGALDMAIWNFQIEWSMSLYANFMIG